MAILTFSEIHKAYGLQEVLLGVTFNVQEGSRTALVGSNGAGKTTLLRIAAGLERADSGRVVLQDGARVGMLDQEPLVGDTRSVIEAAQRPSLAHRQAWADLLALESTMEDGSEAHLAAYDEAHHRYQDLGGYECETRAREILAGLGFPIDSWDKQVAVLSGGERTRLALVQLLVLQPNLLLLDEPTNHVDWDACEWLQEHLGRYPGGVLIVSHDRYFLDRVVDEVVLLDQGTARSYRGNYTNFVARREIEREQDELRYRREQEEIARQEAIIQRLRSHRKFNSMHSREKTLARLESSEAPARAGRTMKVKLSAERMAGQVVLSASGLAFGYGTRTLFSGLNLTLERGDRLGVFGANGTGKSTLLKVLVGELRPAAGQVELGFRVDAVHFDQNHANLDPEATVFDTVYESAEMNPGQAFHILHQFLFSGKAVEKQVENLSGGERTRLALARLMAQRPNLLVLDEPTNHLDIPSREAIEAALVAYSGTLIVVSHDRYLLARVPTRLMEIRPGAHRFFLGNYARLREMASAAPTTAPKAGPVRALAGSRNGRGPRQASPAKRMGQVEKEIEGTEARLTAITSELANPDTYKDNAAGGLSAEFQELTAGLDALYAEWAELAGQVSK